jgi:hypothetical protein
MTRTMLIFVLACLLIPTLALAATLMLYPGSKLDPGLTSGASHGNMHVKVYDAPASYDKVVAFYRGKYKEDKTGEPPVQTKGNRMAAFILDGASSVLTSKHYLTVKENGTSTLLYDTQT